MKIDIAGKVVVVTGAAQGIGRTLALGLGAEGARVAVVARDRGRAQLVVDEIGQLPSAQRSPSRPTSATKRRSPRPRRRSAPRGDGSTR